MAFVIIEHVLRQWSSSINSQRVFFPTDKLLKPDIYHLEIKISKFIKMLFDKKNTLKR